MENISCNFCGSRESILVHQLKDIRMGLPGDYRLVKCSKCGLLYLNPQPTWEELSNHYTNDYHCYCSAVDEQPTALVRWMQQYGLRRRCRAILKLVPRGCLLDIGCATGLFLNEMRQYPGWQVKGVEPVSSASEYARDHFGLDVFQGNLCEAKYPPDSFDVVTLWDVLEHTPDPRAILEEIHRILQPNGLLVIKVPDPESIEARIFGADWVGYEAPQHLFGFPESVLMDHLNRIGFQPIKIEAIGGDYSVFMDSLRVWLQGHGHSSLSRIVKMISKSKPSRIALSPLFILIRQLGVRSSKAYFMRIP